MRYRKLSSTGDFTFGNGQNDFWRDVPEAVGQAVETRLLLWSGEWYVDTDEGTPYMTNILGKRTVDQANATLQDRIQGTQGFVDFVTFNGVADTVKRVYSLGTKINTIYGPTSLQISNYANY